MGEQACEPHVPVLDSVLPIKDQLRSALQKYPAAVTVIAARSENGDFYATTATAVTVVTMDPPTMLCCLNRAATLAGHLKDCTHYSINVLRVDQQAIAEACAGKLERHEREGIGQWLEVVPGAPVWAEAQVSLLCRRSNSITYGTHELLFGEVEAVRIGEGVAPLMYLNRLYGTFQAFEAQHEG